MRSEPCAGPWSGRFAGERAREETQESAVPDAAVAQAEAVPAEVAGLFLQHHRQVAIWASRLGRGQIDVDDVTQEVFMAAHRQLAGFRGGARVSTWLYAITRNVVRDRLRAERTRHFFLTRVTRDPAAQRPAVPTPAHHLEWSQSLQLLHALIAALPETARRAFILFEIEGLSGPEVERALGVAGSTARVWLLRARAHLRKRLERLSRLEQAGDSRPAGAGSAPATSRPEALVRSPRRAARPASARGAPRCSFAA